MYCIVLYCIFKKQKQKQARERRGATKKIGIGVRGFHTSSLTRLESKDQEYFRLLTEKDIGQETNNPHILAKRQIKSGLPVKASIINRILPNLLKPITDSDLLLLREIKPTLLSLNVREGDKLAGPLKYLDPKYLNILIGSAREVSRSKKKNSSLYFYPCPNLT